MFLLRLCSRSVHYVAPKLDEISQADIVDNDQWADDVQALSLNAIFGNVGFQEIIDAWKKFRVGEGSFKA